MATKSNVLATLDADGSGAIEASELLSAFDADGSGTLDMREMEKLASRLSAQVGYNNDLLEQLELLEQAQLRHQREEMERQQALREAVSVCESTRAQANDLRRRLGVSEEVARKMTDDARTARVEADRFKRGLENLERSTAESRSQMALLREERDSLADEVEHLRRQQANLAAELSEAKTSEGTRAAHDRKAIQDLQRELAAVRAKQDPLIAECEAARSNLVKLQEENETLKGSLSHSESTHNTVYSQLRELEELLRQARQNEARAQRELQAEQHRSKALEMEVSKGKDRITSLSAEVSAQRNRAADAANAVKVQQGEVAKLKDELTKVGADLMTQADIGSAETRKWESKLRDAKAELARLEQQQRDAELAYEEDLERKNSELRRLREGADESSSKLQEDHLQLQELLKKHQQDAVAQRRVFEGERAAAEARLADTKAALTAELEDASRQTVALKAANEQLSAELGATRDGTSALKDKHVSTIKALQGLLRQLRTECATNSEVQARVTSELRALTSSVHSASRAVQAPLDDWHADIKRSFLAMLDQIQKAKAEKEDAVDRATNASTQVEEERAKTLMLEDKVDALEFDLSAARSKLETTEAAASQRQEKNRRDLKRMRDERTDLDTRLVRLQAALDKANAQNLALQEDNMVMNQDLADTAAKSNEKVQALEAQLATSDAACRSLRAAKDAAAADKQRLDANIATLKEQLASAQSRLEAVARDSKSSERADSVKARQYHGQVQALSESLSKMQVQLQRTQSLLAVVQEQRTELQQQNAKQRAELDDLYRKSFAVDDPTK